MARRACLKAAPFKISHLQKLWQQYNDEFFEGALHPTTIRITRAKRYYGYFSVTESSSVTRLCISSRLHADPRMLRDTLLHEMCHQYLHQIGDPRWDQHDGTFQALAEKLILTFDEDID